MGRMVLPGLAALFLCVSSQAPAKEPPLPPQMKKTADALMDKALEDDLAYRLVESLTTEIGPRLAGTKAEARARDWAVKKLNSLGFANVRREPFKVRLWTRTSDRAEIVSPFPQPLHITALGYSVATPPDGVEGEVVRFETLSDLEEAPEDGLKGKIVFVDEWMARTQDGSGYGLAVKKRSGAAVEAGKRGAAAALIRSVGTDHHRFPHTGNMGYEEGVPAVPIGALSAPDADQLARAMERGKVRVRLVFDVKGGGRTGDAWEGTPEQLADSANVVAEIPGQTDEIILVGAHLDSWDLGTGAIDDGAGVGIVTAAAKLVGDLPGRPKRTIRVVLFGSEEVGLVGAHAYAEKYKDTLDKHIVGAESDFGARKIWRLQTNWGEDKLERADAFLRVFRRFGIVQGDNEASGGPDMKYVREAGVPVVSLTQNGWDYFDLHHTADDTFDKIDPEELAQNVAVWAAFIYLASELPGDFRAEEGEETAKAGE
ncbi:MAG: M20/M25/M40 family metallo-hydrolase [Alphaproteobacteria bacterium]